MLKRIVVVALMVVSAGCGTAAIARVPAGGGALGLAVLSNRADLVSGGDALVQVEPAGRAGWRSRAAT